MEEQVGLRTRRALIACAPTALAAAFYMLLPLGIVLGGALGSARPGGYGRGFPDLAVLSLRSLWLSLAPAVLACLICTTASVVGRFAPLFRKLYSGWLLLMLFTNPLFLVFGFTALFDGIKPTLATILATAYLLLPLCGVVIQAASDRYPRELERAAQALGAGTWHIIWRHLLPTMRTSLAAAIALATVYALGFYLVPSYVSLGRVSTLGTTIEHAAHQIGDWEAARQLATVALALQALLLMAWVLASRMLLERRQ